MMSVLLTTVIAAAVITTVTAWPSEIQKSPDYPRKLLCGIHHTLMDRLCCVLDFVQEWVSENNEELFAGQNPALTQELFNNHIIIIMHLQKGR